MIKDLLLNDELTTCHCLETIMGETTFDIIDVPYYNETLRPVSGTLVGGTLTFMIKKKHNNYLSAPLKIIKSRWLIIYRVAIVDQ